MEIAPFEVWPPLIGGVLIGLSAGLVMLTLGKIAGISGILSQTLFGSPDRDWRIAFLVGLIGGGFILSQVMPTALEGHLDIPLWAVAVAGLLVGIGTRIGSGCTSGHGICGLPRFSMRSWAAVCTFIFTGMVTVYVVNHVLGGL